MPHFTVVPVKDRGQSSYDSLEGVNWVDYRDTGQDYTDNQDTVSSDGDWHVAACHLCSVWCSQGDFCTLS
uniref:Uncharacterized protein n=1 Tax=Periophthalmus magnuspinnatus TaxID=409849 RepID=A0A3B4BDV0_9GOBI